MAKVNVGIPVSWTGEKFVTPAGRKMNVPAWMLVGMPSIALEGEICPSGKTRSKIASLLRTGSRKIEFVSYDAPGNAPFDARRLMMRRLKLPDHCKVARYIRCAGVPHMREYAAGSEVVLRNPSAPYTDGDDRNTVIFTAIRQDQSVQT